jgi:hypothetical protein
MLLAYPLAVCYGPDHGPALRVLYGHLQMPYGHLRMPSVLYGWRAWIRSPFKTQVASIGQGP